MSGKPLATTSDVLSAAGRGPVSSKPLATTSFVGGAVFAMAGRGPVASEPRATTSLVDGDVLAMAGGGPVSSLPLATCSTDDGGLSSDNYAASSCSELPWSIAMHASCLAWLVGVVPSCSELLL